MMEEIYNNAALTIAAGSELRVFLDHCTWAVTNIMVTQMQIGDFQVLVAHDTLLNDPR